MSTPSCPDLRTAMSALRSLAESFDVAMSSSTKTGDYAEPKRLKVKLENTVIAIEEQLRHPEFHELHLERQYAEQYGILESSGILKLLSSGEKGIRGIDGNEYPVPSLEIVMAKARDKSELLTGKKAQGFTKMLLVPFGMSLEAIATKYGELLKNHHTKGDLKSSKGAQVDLYANLPVYIDDGLKNSDTTGDLVYDPTFLIPQNHGGVTKAQILTDQKATADTSSGWRQILVEDLPVLPSERKGEVLGGRRQLETNRTSAEYHAIIGNGYYENETGLCPEEWFALAITNLETKGEVTDDWSHGAASNLVGAWLPKRGVVSSAYWDGGGRMSNLYTSNPRKNRLRFPPAHR